MNEPNPTLNKPIDSSTKATVLGGLPLATVTVWWLQNIYLKPRGLTLDVPTATAFGILGAAVFGEVWQFLSALGAIFLNVIKEKLK